MKIIYGVVKSVDPLLVYYQEKLILDEDILIIPEYLDRTLCVGDALILLQQEVRTFAMQKPRYARAD